MKGWLTGLAVVGVVVGALWVLFGRSGAEHRGAQRVRELATHALGERVMASGNAKRVLIVANPFGTAGKLNREMQAMEDAGLRGLTASLSPKVASVVAIPELRPGVLEDPRSVFIEPETTTPLSYLVTAEAFDQLARQNAECDVIVSLIGLPADLTRVQCWQDSNGPKFALLLPDLRHIGNRAALRRCFENGKLLAFVAVRPNAPTTATDTTGDWRTEFDRWFVLVTRENLDAMLAAYPQIFPPN